ncbi:MAG: histidine kinase, partial [Bacteroidota bacterium]
HIPSKKWTRIRWNTIEKQEYFGLRFMDSKNRAWTFPNVGAQIFDPHQQQFIEYDYSHLNQGNSGYTYYFVNSVPDSDFAILSRSADGIYFFNTNKRSWTKAAIPHEYLDINGRFVPLGSALSPSGAWTVIGRNAIFDFNPRTGSFKPRKIPRQFSGTQLRSILWDRTGCMWIGTLSTGLLKWNPKTKEWTQIKKLMEPEPSRDNVGRITTLFEDSQGNIWINRAGGYSIFDVQKDTFYNFLDRNQPTPHLYAIEQIVEDQQGRVWLNGISGVIAYGLAKAPKKGLQVQFDLMEEHQIGSIAFIDVDTDDQLWILSAGQLGKLDLKKMQWTFHSLKYGIEEDPIYGFKVLGKDRILIGGENKIWIAQTDDLLPNPEKPIPYLTGINVLQKPYLTGQPAHLIKMLDLSYAENFFSLEFSSIGFTRGTENQFRYRLKNFEDQWTMANQRRFANFTNVPPGNYIFELQVANNESIWNEDIFSLPITVATPWWRQWWFGLTLLLLISGIIYLLYKGRINQVRKEERMRLSYEKKLNTVEMAALRAQMNPHFIFNALNSIEYFIISNEQEIAVDYLNRFSRLVRLILQNSQSTSVPLKDDLEALRLYIEIENMRFDDLFDYDLRIDEGIDLSEVYVPPLLLQPYVENAIWHGLMQKKQGRGKIDISIRKEGRSLICILEDNGIGRAAALEIKSKSATKGKSYGMKITKDRLEALNHLGEARASIQIFDLKDNLGKAKGTRIELFIPFSEAVKNPKTQQYD